MNRIVYIFFMSLLIFLTNQSVVTAQSTGTRLKDHESNYQKSVIWFSQPREITDIRLLLQDGKKELAVEKARDYVASLENISGPDAKQFRYFALNALCAALTSTGETNEAIDTCSRAIEINPSLWQAINNRGTAYYVSGQIESALADYRNALNLVQGSEPLVELIQHNIGLAEKKTSGF